MRVIQLLSEHFASYRDTAQFEGREVCFYKRAQIFVADLWACFDGASPSLYHTYSASVTSSLTPSLSGFPFSPTGKGHGSFEDIDAITMFADYRVPQTLLYFGVLTYSDVLMEFLRTRTPFSIGFFLLA